jgi:hypothetical protein
MIATPRLLDLASLRAVHSPPTRTGASDAPMSRLVARQRSLLCGFALRAWLATLGAPDGAVTLRRHRPRSFLAWSAIFAVTACNAIWGIDDGKLAQSESVQAGAAATEPGGAPPDAGAAAGARAGETGQGLGGANAGAAAGGDGGDATSPGGMDNGSGAMSGSGGASSGSGGSSSGSGGSMSGSGGGGTGPTCTGCKPGETQSENRACGRCGTGTQSHTRACSASCTWGAWSSWSTCSQCDTKNYRCCGAGKWEWCYESDCAWTNDCEACAASSCPEC